MREARSALKFTALKNSIREGASPVYLLEGEEGYFCDKGAEMLKSAFVQHPELDYSTFPTPVKGEAAKRLLSDVYSYPFLSEKRMVRLNEFYPTEKEYERIKDIFESPSPTSVVLIVNRLKPKAGGCDLKKKPNVAYVDCSGAAEEDVLKWIYITFKRAGVAADTSVCSQIASYCSMKMTRVACETEKLIAYAGEGGKIDARTVDELVFQDSDYKLYELTGAVARKNYSKFVSIMKEMMTKGFDEMSFLSSLGFYYKKLSDVLLCPLSDRETAKLLSVKEYAVKKDREQAARIGKQALFAYTDVFYSAVADIKSGVRSPSSALAVAVAKIFF